jgi:hypothetical protein
VHAHEQARFAGSALAHNTHSVPGRDGFDAWCQVRDSRENHSFYGPYVVPGVIGYPPYPPPYPYVWVRP